MKVEIDFAKLFDLYAVTADAEDAGSRVLTGYGWTQVALNIKKQIESVPAENAGYSEGAVKPGTVADNYVDLQWEYEDQLPVLSDGRYNLMYRQSKIIGGVRMFPYVMINDERYYLQ